MMKVSGMWVSPIEVENALLGDERIAEVAVVGAVTRMGRGLVKPVAYIVLVAGLTSASRYCECDSRGRAGTAGALQMPARISFVAELLRRLPEKFSGTCYVTRKRETD